MFQNIKPWRFYTYKARVFPISNQYIHKKPKMRPTVAFTIMSIFATVILTASIDPKTNTIRDTEERLEVVYRHLKNLVQGHDFDNRGFQLLAEYTRDQLLDLSKLISNDTKLMRKLDFTKHVFQEMADAARFLWLYNYDSMDQVLLRYVITLKIRLLMLFDSQGFPDRKIKRYSSTVASISQVLFYWGEAYSRLDHEVDSSFNALFEKQLSDSKILLQTLQSHDSKG